METFSALIHGDLPPAGNRISLNLNTSEDLPHFPGYHELWLDSGTSALAVALLLIRQRHPDIHEPEVVIPAYCCPDLAAAAQYAGFKVVVVDIDQQDAAFSISTLEQALGECTLAVIAVNFLGVREKLAELRQLLQAHPHTSLIEDNAQWFPDPQEFSELAGDYVVFSFGRGKPLSLLGGGLLLTKAPPTDLPAAAGIPASSTLRLKIRAYNLLLHPRLYQLLNRNPLIRLGETRYHPLTDVQTMDELRKSLLPPNLRRYSARSRILEQQYDTFFANKRLLYQPLTSDRRRRLLRYPVLCVNHEQRDAVLRDLQRAGLGATAMYQKPLPTIDEMDRLTRVHGGYSNAAEFADRLITLPLHDGVTPQHLARILRIFDKHQRS